NHQPDSKRRRRGKFPELETGLMEWIDHEGSHVLNDEALLEDKIRSIAKDLQLPVTSFIPSSGWIERFKSRYGLRNKNDQQQQSSSVSSLTNNHLDSASLLTAVPTTGATHVDAINPVALDTSLISTGTTTSSSSSSIPATSAADDSLQFVISNGVSNISLPTATKNGKGQRKYATRRK